MAKNSELATKKDLEAIKQELLDELATKASKEDVETIKQDLLDQLATKASKDDLKNFATKDDLKNLATKDDLKNYATKADLKIEIGEVEKRLSRTESKVDRILEIVDGIAGQFDDYKKEKAAAEHTFTRHERRLDNHEIRIKTLEEKED